MLTKVHSKKLGELCSIIDCEHKTAPTQEEGIPLIRTPNIGQGRLILDKVQRISESTFSKWTRRGEPMPGDLIMAREAPVGNVGLIVSGQRVCLGQRTVLIRVTSDELDPAFLAYLLNSPTVKGYIVLLSTGATVGHLNVTDIRKLSLPPLPPIATQRKIAAILTAYDDLIETNKRRIALLEKMAEEIYREWFVRLRFPGYQNTKFVKGIPEGWEVKRLDAILELAYGKALKEADREAGKFYVYGSGGIIGSHSKALVENPGIIVGRKGNVGAVYFSDRGFFPIDTVFYVVSKLPLTYLFFLLRSMNFINNDAAVPGLNRKQAYSNQFFYPGIELITKFSNLISPIFDLKYQLQQQNENLTKTRDLLLPRLISGKLSVEHLDIQTPPSMTP